MAVIMHKHGGTEIVQPEMVDQYLRGGWFFNKKDAVNAAEDRRKADEIRIEEGKEDKPEQGPDEPQDEEKEELPVQEQKVVRKRTNFKCSECGKRVSRYKDSVMLHPVTEKKICGESCA